MAMQRQAATARFADLAGAAPQAYRGGMYDDDSVIGHAVAATDKSFVQPGPGSAGGRTSPSNGRLNLRGVVEVLQEFGLDPTAELARVLTGSKPLLDRSGEPVLDKDGQPQFVPLIDIEMKTKVLLELQQYVHPKLKSIEVVVKKAELSEEQIDQRIKALQGG